MRLFAFTVFPLTALVMAGCSTTKKQIYAGDARPAAEIAVLRSTSVVQVMELDGKQVDKSDVQFMPTKVEYHVLPGTHSLVARYSVMYDLDESEHTPFRSDPISLTFDTEPGGIYDPKVKTSNERVRGLVNVEMDVDIWVERAGSNAASERPVAGKEHPAVVSEVVPEPAASAAAAVDAETLKKAWSQASEEERIHFLHSIVSDD